MEWFCYLDEEKVIEWRHWLHQHPELSFQEVETSQYIEKTLQEMGNIEISRPTKTSVLGIIRGKKPGKTIGLRADIDALPVREEADVSYRSQNLGVMHACGHDTHAAMLLGAAWVLSQITDELSGTIKLIFQHAEEKNPGGAQEIIATGCLDDVDYFYGSHVFAPMDSGVIQTISGPCMAAVDELSLKIQGRGSHGSMPEKSIDPIMVGASIVMNINQIVSRNVPPLERVVISVGKFISGTAANIIPDTAELAFTVRTTTKEMRELTEKRLREVIDGICKAHGATYELLYDKGYNPLVNDEACTALAKTVAIKLFGEEACKDALPQLGGEDFSYYLEKAPGTFVFIGGGGFDEGCPFVNHHPKFQILDKTLIVGTKMYVGFALEAAKV
ncbi:N-acyl-L-amino acid amidohydrolase [Clostridia bacterium]|nr:N-acyl-L-amino acid amidohydrolase [Clostridia bacterium]